MWYFDSPHIVFGEDALNELTTIYGKRAFVVTDTNIARLGYVDLVGEKLRKAGLEYQVFAEVEGVAANGPAAAERGRGADCSARPSGGPVR